jgi:hypothetical protein
MTKYLFLLLCSTVLLSSGCASMQQRKWLSAHHKNLSALASGTRSGEEKLDGLLADYVQFLREDLRFVDPRKGVKYVKKYHDQNANAIEKILRDTGKWQGDMNLVDKVAFGARAVKKPYIKDLIDLGPKFRRKYKQYEIAAKLAGKMGGSLAGIVKDL